MSFACRIDDEQFQECHSPHERSDLAEGTHEFAVKARDAAGNESASAAFAWMIDVTAPPRPSIADHPPPVTTANEAAFAFSDAEAGAELDWTLDGGEPTPCESPQDYAPLEDGDHEFTVTARDAAGNRSSPAQFKWTIVPDELSLGDGA